MKIFDFDGTLIDSYHCMIDKFLHLADKFHFKKIEREQVESLRDMSSLELIRYLEIPFYKLPMIIKAARKLLRESMAEMPPVPGIKEALKELSVKDGMFGIVTSNAKENVEYWLKLQGLESYFGFIYCEPKFFSKQRLLKKILKKHRVDRKNAWYIGDETRDVEAGKGAGMKTAAVTWGYNSEAALVKVEPDLIIREPSELMKLR